MALVLVVDEFRPITAAVSALIASMGHDAAAAHSGAEAMGFLRRCPTDLIILELALPVVSGLDVLRQLRADATLSRVPVVVFAMSPDACEQATALGVTACVLKHDVDALSAELRRLLPHAKVRIPPPPVS